MLSKKEIAFINWKVASFRRWAQEEYAAARSAETVEEKDECIFQARLNECSADTLDNLLVDLLPSMCDIQP